MIVIRRDFPFVTSSTYWCDLIGGGGDILVEPLTLREGSHGLLCAKVSLASLMVERVPCCEFRK